MRSCVKFSLVLQWGQGIPHQKGVWVLLHTAAQWGRAEGMGGVEFSPGALVRGSRGRRRPSALRACAGFELPLLSLDWAPARTQHPSLLGIGGAEIVLTTSCRPGAKRVGGRRRPGVRQRRVRGQWSVGGSRSWFTVPRGISVLREWMNVRRREAWGIKDTGENWGLCQGRDRLGKTTWALHCKTLARAGFKFGPLHYQLWD